MASHGDPMMTTKNAKQISLCKEIRSRTKVIPRTWIWEKVVFYQWRQSTRRMGQNRKANDVDTRTKRTPSISSHEPIVQRSSQKQRRRKIVDTLLCRPRDDWNCFLYNCFCKSAQSLRSSRRNVWRVWVLHNKTVKSVVEEEFDPLFVPNVIKTNTPLTDDFAQEVYLLQSYRERIEIYHNKTEW